MCSADTFKLDTALMRHLHQYALKWHCIGHHHMLRSTYLCLHASLSSSSIFQVGKTSPTTKQTFDDLFPFETEQMRRSLQFQTFLHNQFYSCIKKKEKKRKNQRTTKVHQFIAVIRSQSSVYSSTLNRIY